MQDEWAKIAEQIADDVMRVHQNDLKKIKIWRTAFVVALVAVLIAGVLLWMKMS